MMALLLSFVLVMALVALNISMIVRVHERAREAALIRGLGADAKYLARVFMTEAFLLSLVASTIGLVMSFGVGHLISHHLTLPDIYYSTRIPMDWNGTLNLGFAGITVVFSVLVSYLPSRRLHKLEVSTMLRS
jgi:ABC-type lipoprotein release transport system permease subunit